MAYYGRKRKDLPNLAGTVFGRLTVLRYLENDKHGQRVWLCRCECGKELHRPGSVLKNGNTKSCGCLHDEVRRARRGTKMPVLSIGIGVAARNTVICNYKRRAKEAGRVWSLTTAQAEAIFRADCHYCGKPPSHLSSSQRGNGNYVYNGIDRIDNTKGYETGNVVPCCKRCNMAKNNMPYLEFIQWIERVYVKLIQAGELANAS